MRCFTSFGGGHSLFLGGGALFKLFFLLIAMMVVPRIHLTRGEKGRRRERGRKGGPERRGLEWWEEGVGVVGGGG